MVLLASVGYDLRGADTERWCLLDWQKQLRQYEARSARLARQRNYGAGEVQLSLLLLLLLRVSAGD